MMETAERPAHRRVKARIITATSVWEQISTGKVLTPGASFVMPDMDETLKAKWKIAYTGINGKGTYYLVSGQSYTLGAGLKVQGDNSSYSGNMTFYVPQSGYYTFE